MVLERLRWPTTSEVLRVLDAATARHGCPARILSDNGSVFRSFDFELWLVVHGVDHTLTKPAHPWTNGRIERLFRTFKATVFAQVRLLGSVAQIDRFCADFVTFYNRDRPHSSYGGRTPDEVWFGRQKQLHSSGRVLYFDGLFAWHRFG